MARAFSVLKLTLTELEVIAFTLPAYSHGDYERPEVFLKGSLAGICQLDKLRTLELPWEFLMGVWDVKPVGTMASSLPSSLEQLTLRSWIGSEHSFDWDDTEIISCLRNEFDSGAMSRCSRLNTLGIPGPDYEGLNQENEVEMGRLSDQYNIKLIHIGDP